MSTIKEQIEKAVANAEKLNPTLNAFLAIHRDGATARAAELDGNGNDLPLKGFPIAVKDNICTSDSQTSCASLILGKFKPQYDATVVKKLNAAGAVIIGKTNLDEF